MEVQTRPARPDDVDAAVPLIYCSGEHEYDYAFATRRHTAPEFVRAAFLGRSRSDSYRGFHVVVVDGKVVGIGSFVGGGDLTVGNTLNILWDALRLYGLREFWGVLRRGLRLQAVMPPPARDELFIQKLGVSPEMRGRGLGTALVNEWIAAAREKGFRRCVLDVTATNPGAQRLYERMGFEVTGERRLRTDDAGTEVLTQRRMALEL
jgi:ribosomal protein S18 acetylase RimI-like enzyme